MQLKDKIALVTGASRGIGKAIALRLAQEGSLVAVHYGGNQEAALAVVDEIKSSGGHAFSVQGDISTLDGLKSLYQTLDSSLQKLTGSNQFDILVNNAGIAPAFKIEDTSEETFDKVFSTNVKGPFFLIQQALPRLRSGGRIINISSVVTRVADADHAAYSATKGALNTLSLLLAAQLGARGITVNSLAPGVTDTDMNAGWLRNSETQQATSEMTALGRVGNPTDIANVAAFLASGDSGWVTGQYIEASGGLMLNANQFLATES